MELVYAEPGRSDRDRHLADDGSNTSRRLCPGVRPWRGAFFRTGGRPALPHSQRTRTVPSHRPTTRTILRPRLTDIRETKSRTSFNTITSMVAACRTTESLRDTTARVAIPVLSDSNPECRGNGSLTMLPKGG